MEKSSVVKKIAVIFIFVLILALIFALTRPLYSRISNSLVSVENFYLNKFTQETGLSVSYESLSPSVFSGISIKNIRLTTQKTSFTDEDGNVKYKDGKDVLFVKRIFLRYNVFKIIKGDFKNSLSKLFVSDINIGLSKELLDSVLSLANEENSSSEQKESKKKENASSKNQENISDLKKSLSALKEIAFSLPFDVSLKNISASYSAGKDFYRILLRGLNLKKDSVNHSLSSDLSGIFEARPEFLNGKTAGVKFKIDGNFSSVLSGSSARIIFDDYARSDFSLKRIENLLVYTGTCFELSSIQQLNNYNFFAQLDAKTSLASANLMLKDFNPFSLVRGKLQNSVLNQIAGTIFSGNLDFKIDLNSMQYTWNTNTSVVLSKKISPLGQNIALLASGTNDYINVSSLDAKGELASFYFTGGFDLKKFVPEGYLNLEYFKLANTNKISGEVFVQDNGKEGFVAFIPELNFGRQKFASIELAADKISSSMNFSLDGFDYSHSEYEKPGSLHIEGSLADGNYVQASVSLDSFFLDSIARSALFFTETQTEQDSGLVSFFNPFVSSMELYFSTDFKTFTFNSPYLLFANTQSDRQLLFLSFDGSENAVNITQFDLLYNQNSLLLQAGADISPEDGQAIFNAMLNFNEIPYEFNGIFADKWLNLSGSYGFELAADFKNEIAGSAHFDSLPLNIGDFLFSFAMNLEFNYKDFENFSVNLANFSADELNGVLRTHPKIALSASADKNGIVFSSINVSDSLAALSGTAYALWNIDDGIFRNLNLNFNLSDEVLNQKIILGGEITNPMQKELSGETMMTDLFFNLKADVQKIPMAFFSPDQQSDDSLTAQVTASGTLENPYIAVNLLGFSYSLGGLPLLAKGNFNILEGNVSIEHLEGSWNGFMLSDSKAEFNIKDFSGDANAHLAYYFNSNSLELPLQIHLENMDGKESKNFIPENFVVRLYAPQLEGNLFESEKHEMNLQIIRTPGRFDFVSDEYLGFYGEMCDDGRMNFFIDESKPFHFTLDGSMVNNEMDLHLQNVYLDLSRFNKIVNSEYFSVYKAVLEGNLDITGLATDPNLDGSAYLSNVEFNLPAFIPEHIFTPKISVDFSQEEISVPETKFSMKDAGFKVSANVGLDRWDLSSASVRLASNRGGDIPVDIKVPFLRIKGHTGIDVNLILQDGNLDLLGDIGIRNSEISLITNVGDGISFDSGEKSNSVSANPMNMNIAINLNVGQKVRIVLDPLIRGLIAPNTPISFSMNTESGLWNLKGDVVLRGGELSYLNRNFYLKEGRIILNETQNYFNPYITVRAETREHDENGDPITIKLSAVRQNVSNFHATLYSSPSKSETEILNILGQIASGDSESAENLLLSTVDYGVSVTLVRRLESALRDLFNFDIFSVRTALLQNTLKQGLNVNTGSEKAIFGSNLFDNSTVYIGKYFGSSVYADALMHWSYDESKANKTDGTGGLVFQPEVGLELDSPFANIRWSFAPDLGELQYSWVSASSITLSWRLSF